MNITSSRATQKTLDSLNLKKPALLWGGLLAIPLLAVIVFAVAQPIKVVPRIGLAPGFILTDMHGRQLTNEDLRGQIVIYNFTTTSCEAPCIDTAPIMQALQEFVKQLDTGGIPVTLVTISLDPERDTPERLQAYARRLNADPARWHFVTGSPERLKQVVGGGFELYYTQDEHGVFHFAPMLAIVDGNGILRARYKRGLEDVAIAERDLMLMLEEARNSSGAAGLVYEAAHLFLCYPTY
ncbi:SCO family protein [Caldilinea sp.]|jgi:protein SCO1/2|uniref:SCO family protein n=1 Tax=Caldilinea sp. TaxID=2293560 RepID=UPI0021DCDA61|nr:SCO family protein [Caldilinea sp.]GIV68896.1 MAG: electron transporter SenC [Caldilinea sp.]